MDQKTGYTALALNSFLLRLNDIGAIKMDTERDPPLHFNLNLADNKQGPLGYHEVQQMAEFMYAYINDRKLRFDGICGIPRAGEPFAEELQKCYFYRQGRDMPRVILEKYEGDSVRQMGNAINQEVLRPRAKVLLLDDLITRADSKLKATKRLRDAGYLVEDCVVFLDREQGGARQTARNGVKLHSVTCISSTLEVYKDAKRITLVQYHSIHAYLKNTQ